MIVRSFMLTSLIVWTLRRVGILNLIAWFSRLVETLNSNSIAWNLISIWNLSLIAWNLILKWSLNLTACILKRVRRSILVEIIVIIRSFIFVRCKIVDVRSKISIKHDDDEMTDLKVFKGNDNANETSIMMQSVDYVLDAMLQSRTNWLIRWTVVRGDLENVLNFYANSTKKKRLL